MNTRIHPEFRPEAKLAAVSGILVSIAGCFFLFWGVVLLGVAAGFLSGFGGFQPSMPVVSWALIFASLGSGVLLAAFARHLLFVFPAWLRRASWLLAHAQPRKMFLDFDLAERTRGRDAILREVGGSGTGESIELRSPLYKFRDLNPMPVGVCRETVPDGIVVIFADDAILWGFRMI